jgi:two-component system sensor histidine kinase NreB
MLDDFGLYPALTWLVNRTADQTGLTINRNFTEQNDTRYARAVETAIFRIAQEALANFIHHAQATEVQITLEEKEGRLSFQARDNGTGFDLKNWEMRRGHLTGISSMQERARQAGGSLTIESALSRGTLITAVFPLVREKSA